ncbi:hypothetical protein BGW42_007238 [Actinomortierella wolfii]|nr:hypothetical protein BGW42_007238 [Actinomortierella wolfii]
MDPQLQAHVHEAVQEHAAEHASLHHAHSAQLLDSQIGLATSLESSTLAASTVIQSSTISKTTHEDDILSLDEHHPQDQTRQTSKSKHLNSRDVFARRLGRAVRHGDAYSEDEEDDDDDDDDDDDRRIYGFRRRAAGASSSSRNRRRRRRHLPTANELLHAAPAIPDMRFDSNYRKALDHIYQTYAHDLQVARTRIATAQALERDSAVQPPAPMSREDLDRLTPEQRREYEAELQRYRDYQHLYQERQKRLLRENRIATLNTRITVMTLRDIIIMPFIHGFFWGFGAILLGIISQRGVAHYVVKAWRQWFPPAQGQDGSAPRPLPAIRGEPARIRRPGNVGLGLGIGGGGSPLSAM